MTKKLISLFIRSINIRLSIIITMTLLSIFMPLKSLSQCGTFISTFPYNEGFEAAPEWIAGGTNSDWAWGTPSHPIISGAGGGLKCWTSGGLSGSFYNYSEQSWIMSPCFDFSALNYPWISFKIFWEDEWKYDGLVLQASINGGTIWTNVGAYGDAINCENDHWYNYNNINWLTTASPKHGWTGRTGVTSGSCQGGNGSLGWVTAKHCLSSLAGQQSVRFRFLFGSGTTCNSYDGISIDDILIQNTSPNVSNFSFACNGGNAVSFTNLSTTCPTGYTWDSGDIASGVSNTSTQQNPSHTFSTEGVFNVTLTSNGPCNAPGSITIPVTLLSVSTAVTNVSCNGTNDGTATANVIGSSGPFTYSWTPGSQTTQTISGLSAGTYTITVNATNSCSGTAIATITQGDTINLTITNPPAICLPGTVDITAASVTSGSTVGGTLSFWTDVGTTNALSSPNAISSSGTYYIKSTLGSCFVIKPVMVSITPKPFVSFTANDTIGCVPTCIRFTDASTIATGSISSWLWNFGDNEISNIQNPLPHCFTLPGMYSVTLTVTSGNGCSATFTHNNMITVFTNPTAEFSFSPDPPSITDSVITFNNLSSSDVNFWDWDFGDGTTLFPTIPNPVHSYPSGVEATYIVQLIVNTVNDCSDTINHSVTLKPEFTFFAPNMFTPNTDGLNEVFLPKGTGWNPEKYKLLIFDRWGNLCFQSTDMNKGWEGKTKNVHSDDQMDVYVWKVQLWDTNKKQYNFIGTISIVK